MLPGGDSATHALSFKIMSRGHARESGKGPTQRSLRAGELVRHAVAEILMRGEIHDPVTGRPLISARPVAMLPAPRVVAVEGIGMAWQIARVAVGVLYHNT